MRCISLTGADDRMDCRDMFYDPINPLPAKCPRCGFPNLDYVPQPYFLVKSRTMSPNELAPAENGNFLVRERIRRVLEILAPGECTFFPTCYKGTSTETPWQLAVPKNQVVTAKVNPSISRCESCGEPQSAHPGSQYSEWLFNPQARGPKWTGESEYHLLKSSTWGSSEKSWKEWISRDLFMSLRLFHLLRKIKAKGLDECGKTTMPDRSEAAWVQSRMQQINEDGIALNPIGSLSAEDAKWFRDYVKRHSASAAAEYDIKAAEKRLKFKLPKSYVDFVMKVGPVSFENVDEQEGFTACILSPHDLDSKGFRAGCMNATDEESNAIDGVMFARTEHGDSFCFDIKKTRKEFQVFLYKHDYNCFELYAENFAACIKRFACKSNDESV